MKTIRIFSVTVLIILILTACSPKPTATVNSPLPQATAVKAPSSAETAVSAPASTDTSVPAPVVAEPTATTAALSDAEMKALITEKAHDKHTLSFILSHKMTAEQWSVTLDRMIGYGAKISPEEKTIIIKWLVALNN